MVSHRLLARLEPVTPEVDQRACLWRSQMLSARLSRASLCEIMGTC
jgi:hypothetical protein